MKESVSEPIEKSFDLQEAPEGWQIALTEDISQIVGGGTPKTSDNSNFSEDGYPWITPADLNGFSGMYINRGKRSLSAQGLRTSSAVLMPKGTVLMSSRAPIGYLAIAANELCTNQGFKSFICHQGVVPEYVFLWLKFITPFLENMGSGSTFLEISGTRARKIPILLAPTSEQKRIVAKVEELLARVNSAKERLNKVSVILKHFRQAILSAACSGRLTADWRNAQNDSEQVGDIQEVFNDEIPKGWIRNKLAQVAKINMGQSPPGRSYNKRGEGFPFFQGKIDFGDRFPTVRVWCTEPKKIAQPGDVLISIRAPVRPTNIANQVCAIGRGLAAISPEYGMITEFILYVLRLKEPELALSGTGSTFTAINRKNLEEIDINVPPIEEQHEIVHRAESMFKLADAVEKRVEAAKVGAEKLTQAILAKAFRGELVPTEAELARREARPYESASELLARIKADGESKEGSKSVNRIRRSQRRLR